VLNLSTYKPSPQELKLVDDFEKIIATEVIEKNALIYIAGYVAHRFRNEFSELGIPTKDLPNPQPNDWLCMLSRGNCIYPSASFQEAAAIMENEFHKFHGNFFNKQSKIFDKLTHIVCTKTNNNFPRQVIACLVRTRTYIRLRKINKDITQNNLMRKKSKKLYKLCNKENQVINK